MILGVSPTSQACLVVVPWKQLAPVWTLRGQELCSLLWHPGPSSPSQDGESPGGKGLENPVRASWALHSQPSPSVSSFPFLLKLQTDGAWKAQAPVCETTSCQTRQEAWQPRGAGTDQ